MRCIVPSCANVESKVNAKANFHNFPRDSALCQAWLDAIGIGELPKKRRRVCSDHFVNSDYSGGRLKPGAVPSLLPSVAAEPLEVGYPRCDEYNVNKQRFLILLSLAN